MSQNFAQVQSDLFSTKQVVFIDQFFKKLNTSSLGSNKSEAFTLLLKCEQIGFSFDSQLLNVVSHASLDEMEKFWNFIQSMNKKVFSGADYKPMYPNFPKQVINANELELLINAYNHYLGDFFGFRAMPSYKEKERKKLKESVNPIRMSVITQDDIPSYFVNFLTANASLSPSSKELIKNIFNYLLEKDSSVVEDILLKNEIPQKENLAFVGALVLNSSIDFNKVLAHQFKTPTDLLRLSAALNNGDTSLATNTKVKNMSRPMRKAFAAKLESLFQNGDQSQFLENMFSYKEQWTRLAFAMHIGEYKNKCPLAFNALQRVRSNDKDESFNFQVEKLINQAKPVEASQLLKSRPGIFGRMLNQVLTKSHNKEEQNLILENFNQCSSDISTPVLLQIHAKFKYDNQDEKKIILPKGGLGKTFVLDKNSTTPKKAKTTDTKKTDNAKITSAMEQAFVKKYGAQALAQLNKNLEEQQKLAKEKAELEKINIPKIKISDELANKIVNSIENTLIERFKNAPSLGNVYIEDSLALQNIPFAQRTASKTLKTVSKGSRFAKESDKPIIRFFTWWNENGFDKDGKAVNVGRVDIDLSVGIFDKDYKLIKQCAYYELNSGDYLTHSGDITSAPKGAAEYIDVHIEKLVANNPNAAFVGQLISSYSGQKYSDMPECYAGWMEREKMQRGEIFEPSTVVNKVDITCEGTQVLLSLYDINRKEYIWADTPVKSLYTHNLNSDKGTIAYTIEALAEMKKPKLLDLFEMHAKARGNIVTDKNKADTVFSLHEGTTPFDFEVIASQFMADSFSQPENNNKPTLK